MGQINKAVCCISVKGVWECQFWLLWMEQIFEGDLKLIYDLLVDESFGVMAIFCWKLDISFKQT